MGAIISNWRLDWSMDYLWWCSISQVACRFVLVILADGVIDVALNVNVWVIALVSILLLSILGDAIAAAGVTARALSWISWSVGC